MASLHELGGMRLFGVDFSSKLGFEEQEALTKSKFINFELNRKIEDNLN